MYCPSIITLAAIPFASFAFAVPIVLPPSSLDSYDVVIVGGDPAGLSAASALGRVRDSVLLVDSGEYRKFAL